MHGLGGAYQSRLPPHDLVQAHIKGEALNLLPRHDVVGHLHVEVVQPRQGCVLEGLAAVRVRDYGAFGLRTGQDALRDLENDGLSAYFHTRAQVSKRRLLRM